MTTIRLGELALEAGLPQDLFQVLPGRGSVIGERFVTHPDVRKIVFTGSTEVGVKVMAGAAAQVKRVTLELGGKSANIVFDDCDLERAAATAPYGVFDNAGQDCCARSRILVQRSAYDEFVSGLQKSVQALKVIDPGQDESEMGPMVSAAQRDSVQRYIDGADVAFTGTRPDGDGFWLPPTVVESRTTSEPVWREEVFGPVVAVMAFDDEEEAIAMANDSRYGLNANVFGPTPEAIRVARRIHAGNITINGGGRIRPDAPWGGYGSSGIGREAGNEGFREFFEIKHIQWPIR